MPIRRGEEYLESLKDGRRVWLMGQRVEDVTTHPALAGCARSVAASRTRSPWQTARFTVMDAALRVIETSTPH